MPSYSLSIILLFLFSENYSPQEVKKTRPYVFVMPYSISSYGSVFVTSFKTLFPKMYRILEATIPRLKLITLNILNSYSFFHALKTVGCIISPAAHEKPGTQTYEMT